MIWTAILLIPIIQMLEVGGESSTDYLLISKLHKHNFFDWSTLLFKPFQMPSYFCHWVWNFFHSTLLHCEHCLVFFCIEIEFTCKSEWKRVQEFVNTRRKTIDQNIKVKQGWESSTELKEVASRTDQTMFEVRKLLSLQINFFKFCCINDILLYKSIYLERFGSFGRNENSRLLVVCDKQKCLSKI